MTHATPHVAALALSALMTLAVVAGINDLAAQQYAAADSLAIAHGGQAHVAVQRVVIVGRRATA